MKGIVTNTLCFYFFITRTFSSPLETVHEWKYIDYLWKSKEHKQEHIRSGNYDDFKQVPVDVERAKDGRTFVTIMKTQGVPVSLTTISKEMGPSGPLLAPYPDWSWYKHDDCNGITNVFRVAIDDCNRLWVIDNGHVGEVPMCPAQLLSFDLSTDTLLQRIVIPKNVSQNAHGVGKLVTPVVETIGAKCEKTTVFLSDETGFGLVIWNGERLFRLEARVFQPDNSAVNYTIADQSFTSNSGLVGMALSPKLFVYEPRYLIFRPMSSRAMYMAQSRVLSRSHNGETVKYDGSDHVLPSQATAMVIDKDGTLLFGLTTETSIACWNRYTELRKSNIEVAVTDSERLQFISGLKVIPTSRSGILSEELYALSNRLQRIKTGTININEINFRILKSPVEKLIAKTNCKMPLRLQNAHNET